MVFLQTIAKSAAIELVGKSGDMESMHIYAQTIITIAKTIAISNSFKYTIITIAKTIVISNSVQMHCTLLS